MTLQIIRDALLLLLLQIQPGCCNVEDKLLDWQQQIWEEDKNIAFFFLRNDEPQGVEPGCYSVVGDKPTAFTKTGAFVAPMEYYWTNKKYLPEKKERWGCDAWCPGYFGFKLVPLGVNRYNMRFTVDSLKGVVILIQQLSFLRDGPGNVTETRWVGVIRVKGQLLALKYGWMQLKFVFGFPTGVNRINLHGHPIDNCKIDYTREVVMSIKGGQKVGKKWELKAGEDPLCACLPIQTCADQAIKKSGVDSCEMVKRVIHPLWQEPMFIQYEQHMRNWADYVNKEGKPGLAEYVQISHVYDEDNLVNVSCATLPPKVPAKLADALERCVATLLFQMSLSDSVFFAAEDGGWLRGKTENGPLNSMESIVQVSAILENPFQRYFQCVKTEGAVAMLAFMRTDASTDREIVQGQIDAALDSYQFDEEEIEDAKWAEPIVNKALVFTNSALLLIFCCGVCLQRRCYRRLCRRNLCCCCCCFPCCREKQAENRQAGRGSQIELQVQEEPEEDQGAPHRQSDAGTDSQELELPKAHPARHLQQSFNSSCTNETMDHMMDSAMLSDHGPSGGDAEVARWGQGRARNATNHLIHGGTPGLNQQESPPQGPPHPIPGYQMPRPPPPAPSWGPVNFFRRATAWGRRNQFQGNNQQQQTPLWPSHAYVHGASAPTAPWGGYR